MGSSLTPKKSKQITDNRTQNFGQYITFNKGPHKRHSISKVFYTWFLYITKQDSCYKEKAGHYFLPFKIIPYLSQLI